MGRTTTAPKQRTPLTRERIVDAALQVMDAEGLDALSMRRVAREVGVEAMSLYNHVRDKEDILDGVTEAVLSEFRWEPSSQEWLVQARAVAAEWRRILERHPAVITALVERKHPLMSVESLRSMEVALDLLRRAGLSERETVDAFQAIGGYIFGFVMMEVGTLAPGIAGPSPDLTPEALSRMVPPELPTIAHLLPWFASCDMDATFELGLDLLLDGIRARTADARP
jgi:AcrR family transcriptional regulator